MWTELLWQAMFYLFLHAVFISAHNYWREWIVFRSGFGIKWQWGRHQFPNIYLFFILPLKNGFCSGDCQDWSNKLICTADIDSYGKEGLPMSNDSVVYISCFNIYVLHIRVVWVIHFKYKALWINMINIFSMGNNWAKRYKNNESHEILKNLSNSNLLQFSFC